MELQSTYPDYLSTEFYFFLIGDYFILMGDIIREDFSRF